MMKLKAGIASLAVISVLAAGCSGTKTEAVTSAATCSAANREWNAVRPALSHALDDEQAALTSDVPDYRKSVVRNDGPVIGHAVARLAAAIRSCHWHGAALGVAEYKLAMYKEDLRQLRALE